MCKVFFFISLQVIFRFNQYTSLSDVDSKVASVNLLEGYGNVHEALTLCNSVLFAGNGAGRKRVLIVLMAGRSTVSLTTAAITLKTAKVKVIAVGMGSSFSNQELITMAYSSSYALYSNSFTGLAGKRQTVSNLVSEGKRYNNE